MTRAGTEGSYAAAVMAPWQGLRGPFLAAWLLGVACLLAAAVLFLADYDRFSWPPVIPVLTIAAAVFNLVAVWSRRAARRQD